MGIAFCDSTQLYTALVFQPSEISLVVNSFDVRIFLDLSRVLSLQRRHSNQEIKSLL